MSAFDEELSSRLKDVREQGLYRQLHRLDSAQGPRIEIDGKPLLNFSSNDYLGLANDPSLKTAALDAVNKFGAGAGASRLICGSMAPHHQLEEALASFKETEAALAFSSGYAAATGTIGALLDSNDVVVVDKLVHACIVDGARLSGAKLRVFGHNNLNDLAKILRWADRRHASPPLSPTNRRPRTLIISESIYSMDGDQAPLREMVELKDKFGAWLMVDEAHATGLYGKSRRGLAEENDVAARIEIQMGTLGKAFGSSGGYICGSRPLIDCLINRARPFVFTTAPVPAAAAAAAAGVRLAQSDVGEKRRNQLWANVAQICRHIESKGSAIIPIMVGDEQKAAQLAAMLRERGVFIPAIRFPTVSRGQARLRLTVTAAHTREDIEQLLTVLRSVNLASRP
ncbi:MAG TPA: 8-amino-7-oxononanoate synthase [Verrucomicrobiae bacterium]|jgi:8-amino-7-oxononanoate synthase|nr:8-amino-7-oxononanoate synthase [Verrucomicrobiae bacterium]